MQGKASFSGAIFMSETIPFVDGLSQNLGNQLSFPLFKVPQSHLIQRSLSLSRDLVTTLSKAVRWGMNPYHKESWASDADGPYHVHVL